MKKLMMILASLTFTSAFITSVVSCTNVVDITQKTNYHVIPNVASIKATIQKLNYNADNFDVDLASGMKTAIICSMPDVTNQPFLTKKINLDWTTNDLTKIITFTSLPYSEEAVGKPADPARVLAVINVLNGTNFMSDDVQIIMEGNNYKMIAKEGSNFTGELEIISEAVTFDQVYSVVNLGNVYLNSAIYNNWKKDPTGNKLIMAATLMEFTGDCNRFSAFYSQAIMQAFMQGGILDITIDDQFNGTFYLSGSVPNIFNDSNVTFKFHVILDHRKYLNYNNKKPKNMAQIKVNLTETYAGNNLNDIRYAVVKELLGKDFAEQYKDLWYDELLVDKPYNPDKKELVFRAKPDSKILASSDKMASILTKQPFYKIIATLQ
ncbi:hypothetical protein [Spiroplasma endosymbiont of Seladonia tumulorum]|uniref:hypothetical protein n=1 Tax=Spiroplasma endosymbiont of Seladonia tumulorum TaxID=3066321 RepID=UPI0030D55F0D